MKHVAVLLILLSACGGSFQTPYHQPQVEVEVSELSLECQTYLKQYSLPLRHTFDQALPCLIDEHNPWPPEVPWMSVRTTVCSRLDGKKVTYKTENYFDMQVVIWYKNDKIMGYDSPTHPMCSTQYQDLVWRDKNQNKDCVETVEALCIY